MNTNQIEQNQSNLFLKYCHKYENIYLTKKINEINWNYNSVDEITSLIIYVSKIIVNEIFEDDHKQDYLQQQLDHYFFLRNNYNDGYLISSIDLKDYRIYLEKYFKDSFLLRYFQYLSEFVNYFNMGILPGDININLIKELSKQGIYNDDRIINIINECYTDYIPRYGIRYDFDNTNNIELRQIMIENEVTLNYYKSEDYYRLIGCKYYETKNYPFYRVILSILDTYRNSVFMSKDKEEFEKINYQFSNTIIANIIYESILKKIQLCDFEKFNLDNIFNSYVPIITKTEFVADLKEKLTMIYLENQYNKISKDMSKKKSLSQKSYLLRYKIMQILKLNSSAEEWEINNKIIIKYIHQFCHKLFQSLLQFSLSESNPLFKEELVSEKDQWDENKFRKNIYLTMDIGYFKNLNKKESSELDFHFAYAEPMVSKPLQWTSIKRGGYYSKPTSFIRMSDTISNSANIYANADMNQIFDSLTKLGDIGWKVNEDILSLVYKLKDEGGGYGEINYYDDEKFNEYLSQFDLPPKKIETIKYNNYSQLSYLEMKLRICENYKKTNCFWFPHNIDFRGRCYPLPPHFNHMGSDINRGLLTFAERLPLGPDGFRWLKIHLANKMDMSKKSFEERIDYVDSNSDYLRQMAREPLYYRSWLDLEECFQAIATMKEYDRVLLLHEEYLIPLSSIHSALPIQVDGSCNGLQHYAALGRDVGGAGAVSLVDSDRPGDVYTRVLEIVNEKIDVDADKGHELAIKLKGKIFRKIIKQSVMTTVYGVTLIGAKDQISRQLYDYYKMEDKELYKCSLYLAKVTLSSVSDLYSAADQIKQWLKDCARIVGTRGKSTAWTTPLGLPCVQPYFSYHTKAYKDSYVAKNKPKALRSINLRKQQTAFPPNYIHSLDSTHMLFTLNECKEMDIPFASIHDSFWVLPAHVESLNEIIRRQFIRLHSMPLLEGLKEEFQHRMPNESFPEIPQKGEFDLEEIMKSKYFFC